MKEKTDLRIIKTYSALREAFTKLLSQKIFEEISVNELCDTASIRRTTFYKHFSDKYDYFNFYINEILQEFRNKVPYDIATQDPVAYASRRIHDSLDFIQNHKKLIKYMKNSNMLFFFYQTFQKQMGYELEQLIIHTGGQKKTPQTEALIAFYSGALISLVGWCIEYPDKLTEDELCTLLVNALSPYAFSKDNISGCTMKDSSEKPKI